MWNTFLALLTTYCQASLYSCKNTIWESPRSEATPSPYLHLICEHLSQHFPLSISTTDLFLQLLEVVRIGVVWQQQPCTEVPVLP